MTTIQKLADKSSRSVLTITDQHGTETQYQRTGCTGDKRRRWFTYDRDPLSHLEPADKQSILDTLHRCSASLSITL